MSLERKDVLDVVPMLNRNYEQWLSDISDIFYAKNMEALITKSEEEFDPDDVESFKCGREISDAKRREAWGLVKKSLPADSGIKAHVKSVTMGHVELLFREIRLENLC